MLLTIPLFLFLLSVVEASLSLVQEQYYPVLCQECVEKSEKNLYKGSQCFFIYSVNGTANHKDDIEYFTLVTDGFTVVQELRPASKAGKHCLSVELAAQIPLAVFRRNVSEAFAGATSLFEPVPSLTLDELTVRQVWRLVLRNMLGLAPHLAPASLSKKTNSNDPKLVTERSRVDLAQYYVEINMQLLEFVPSPEQLLRYYVEKVKNRVYTDPFKYTGKESVGELFSLYANGNVDAQAKGPPYIGRLMQLQPAQFFAELLGHPADFSVGNTTKWLNAAGAAVEMDRMLGTTLSADFFDYSLTPLWQDHVQMRKTAVATTREGLQSPWALPEVSKEANAFNVSQSAADAKLPQNMISHRIHLLRSQIIIRKYEALQHFTRQTVQNCTVFIKDAITNAKTESALNETIGNARRETRKVLENISHRHNALEVSRATLSDSLSFQAWMQFSETYKAEYERVSRVFAYLASVTPRFSSLIEMRAQEEAKEKSQKKRWVNFHAGSLLAKFTKKYYNNDDDDDYDDDAASSARMTAEFGEGIEKAANIADSVTESNTEDRDGGMTERGAIRAGWENVVPSPINAKANEDEICPICYSKFDRDDALVRLPCKHHMHRSCGRALALNAFQVQPGVPTASEIKCPVCRHSV